VTYSVRVLRRGKRDVQEIYDYIMQEAPLRADPFIDKLIAAIDSLATMPDRGALPREPVLRDRGFRFLVHGPYLIFYRVQGRQVRVHRILRGNRAYQDLL
jgi:plasmid stabilization system protein ParE